MIMKRFCTLLILSLSLAFGQQGQFRAFEISTNYDATAEQVAQLMSREVNLKRDFSLIKDIEKESPVARYLMFHQSYDGTPLHHAGIKVCMDKEGTIRWGMDFLNRSVAVPSAKASWTVSEQAIRFRLLKQFSTLDVQLAKVWYVSDNALIPVWRAWTFSHGRDESYEVIIHAETGEELERSDRAVYHNHGNSKRVTQLKNRLVRPSSRQLFSTMTDTPGMGRVWIPNPITRSGVPYGTLLSDNSDTHNQAFEPFIDTVVLQDLTFENGVFKLEGPHVRILDLNPNFYPPASSQNGEFYYSRDQSQWEDVMVYYHVDTYQRYIQSLGFTNLWGDRPLQADPHGSGNNDNSFFIPDDNNSKIIFGDGGVDDAEDGDVILHEYGHALSYAASPNTNVGFERRGLDEGFGDYFTASFSYDVTGGGYGWGDVMNWDGHNPFWSGRQADNNDIYNSNVSDFYVYSELWASAMMDARQTLGGAIVDKLQFETLYGLSPNMAVPDAAKLVIAADWMYNNGVHEAALKTIFCGRRILTGTDCLVTSNEPDIAMFSWAGNADQGTLSVDWKDLQPREWNANIVDIQGRIIGKMSSQKPTLTGMSSGVYIVNMSIQGVPAGSKKQIVL